MSTLLETLNQNHFSISLSQGKLTGAGMEFLFNQAQESRFFLLGEDHGIGDNLNFSAALLNILQPHGYNTYVTEIGPESAKLIGPLAKTPNVMEVFGDFYAKYPFSIPFAWLKEEVELLASLDSRSQIIGIDQEFILAPQIFLETLKEICNDKHWSETLTNWLEAERKTVREMVSGKPIDQLALFMNIPLPEEWGKLKEHFQYQNNMEGIALIDALSASHEIYMFYKNESYHLNNFVRSNLMKKYFYREYKRITDAQSGAKFFIKLGANHIERGHSAMGIQDIGNFISELALMEDSASFHLFVSPMSGTQNAWLPFLPEGYKAYPLEENNNPAFAPLLETITDRSGWHLFDLRPLRHRLNTFTKGNPEFKKLIQGYDAILFMYDVKAAHLVS